VLAGQDAVHLHGLLHELRVPRLIKFQRRGQVLVALLIRHLAPLQAAHAQHLLRAWCQNRPCSACFVWKVMRSGMK
jgi:hypothetical protein